MGDGFIDEQVTRAARTYSAAADHWSAPALGFWDRFGAATVARIPLSAGQFVLDLCCGAGASALPAAQAVGPAGRVVAIDLAEPLLELGRARTAATGVNNIEFRCADARTTGLPNGAFDVVICVFGVFFVPDMEGFLTEMWRLVRPGGRLAITTWGPGLFEPASGVFWEAVRAIEPSLFKAFNPWDIITTPAALRDLLDRSGIHGAQVEAVPGHHPIADPEEFWDVVLGSGYRGTVDALGSDQRRALRERVVTQLADRAVLALRTDVVFGSAVRTAD